MAANLTLAACCCCPAALQPGRTSTLSGRQLNGLSWVSYGDDAQMATNYPLVRILNDAANHVFYCRTHDHTSMAVNTGMVVHSTHFDVPAGIELGSAPANGIGSDLLSATVFLPTVSTCLVINAILGTAITIDCERRQRRWLSGGGYVFSAAGLPCWPLMAANGTICGTSTEAASFNVQSDDRRLGRQQQHFTYLVTVLPGK